VEGVRVGLRTIIQIAIGDNCSRRAYEEKKADQHGVEDAETMEMRGFSCNFRGLGG
jgi:hypothetical protein